MRFSHALTAATLLLHACALRITTSLPSSLTVGQPITISWDPENGSSGPFTILLLSQPASGPGNSDNIFSGSATSFVWTPPTDNICTKFNLPCRLQITQNGNQANGDVSPSFRIAAQSAVSTSSSTSSSSPQTSSVSSQSTPSSVLVSTSSASVSNPSASSNLSTSSRSVVSASSSLTSTISNSVSSSISSIAQSATISPGSVSNELNRKSSSLSTGAKVGIALGAVFGAALLALFAIVFIVRRRRQQHRDYDRREYQDDIAGVTSDKEVAVARTRSYTDASQIVPELGAGDRKDASGDRHDQIEATELPTVDATPAVVEINQQNEQSAGGDQARTPAAAQELPSGSSLAKLGPTTPHGTDAVLSDTLTEHQTSATTIAASVAPQPQPSQPVDASDADRAARVVALKRERERLLQRSSRLRELQQIEDEAERLMQEINKLDNT